MHRNVRAGIALTLAAGVSLCAPDGRAEPPSDVSRGATREVELTSPAPPGALREPQPEPSQARSGPHRTVVVGGIGLSATFVALGGVLLIGAEKRQEASLASVRSAGPNGCFRMRWPMCHEAVAAHDEMRAFRSVGFAGLIAGGAVLAATLGYTFFPRGPAEVRVSGEGIAVTGTF
ncbi:hypothetical protein [Sorangium sp. So ce854]|uniref:hypothetical protein n=1 Tax=Sorangium sp. So ce854 TaxID=3133322 RepID=UPI003F633DA4